MTCSTEVFRFNQTGGTSTVTVGNNLVIGSTDSDSSTQTFAYNLGTGGTLTVNGVITVNPQGTRNFTFNGGTLKAGSSQAAFMSGLNNAFIDAGGAAIDAQAFNIGIGQALLHTGAGTDGGLSIAGTGTLTLSGANSYNGPTTVNGKLRSGAVNVIPDVSAMTVNGSWDMNANSETITSLAGTGIIDTLAGGTPTLTVNGAASTNFGGSIQNTTGALQLIKSGTGTLTLSGVSTYTGPTTVAGGTLLVSGGLTGSNVTVQAGTLGSASGGGFITGAVTVGDGTGSADAILSPGASIGTLSTGPVSFLSDAAFTLEINSNTLTTDLLTSTGTISLGAGLVPLSGFDLGGTTLTGAQTFTFLHAAGGVTGTFAGLAEGASLTIGATNFTISYAANGGQDVVLTAVPEPSTALTLLGGLGLLLGVRRRHNT